MSERQSFQSAFGSEISKIETFLKSYFTDLPLNSARPIQQLLESMNYSLMSGGKRFRPVLSLLTAQALGGRDDQVLPWAAAVELIHTYSLVHDDLPMMDNDDFRRGEPTNHKVYGDAMALLAGDSLLTEAFAILGQSYQSQAFVAELVALLGQAAGIRGMIGGQVLDIAEGDSHSTEAQVTLVHDLKTGALIRTAVEGATVACKAQGSRRQALVDYAQKLGLAFQVADDILDWDPENPESASFPAILGLEATKTKLRQLTKEALDHLEVFGSNAEGLKTMAQMNESRCYQ